MSNANDKPSKYRLLYANIDAPTDYRRMAYFICFYLGNLSFLKMIKMMKIMMLSR